MFFIAIKMYTYHTRLKKRSGNKIQERYRKKEIKPAFTLMGKIMNE